MSLHTWKFGRRQTLLGDERAASTVDDADPSCDCRETGWDIDCIVPVPDGSRPAAIQMSAELGLPYREGLVKNRYVGRTFIMPDQVWQCSEGPGSYFPEDRDVAQHQHRHVGPCLVWLRSGTRLPQEMRSKLTHEAAEA